MAKVQHIVSIDNVAALKLMKNDPTGSNVICTLGSITIGDNKGALYYYDATSTEVEDTVSWNIVQITGQTTGRWKKVFTRRLQLPHGILYLRDGKREFFSTGNTVAADGTSTCYLTMDGTATGTAIFSKILFDDSKANVNATSANDAVGSCTKSISADLKVLVHLFYRGNSNGLTLAIITAGLTLLGFRNAASGTPVTFKVEGE